MIASVFSYSLLCTLLCCLTVADGRLHSDDHACTNQYLRASTELASDQAIGDIPNCTSECRIPFQSSPNWAVWAPLWRTLVNHTGHHPSIYQYSFFSTPPNPILMIKPPILWATEGMLGAGPNAHPKEGSGGGGRRRESSPYSV